MEIIVGCSAIVSLWQKMKLRSDVDGLIHAKQLLNLLCIVYEAAKTRTQQTQRVAWQLEIPGLPNNTENLKQKKIIS